MPPDLLPFLSQACRYRRPSDHATPNDGLEPKEVKLLLKVAYRRMYEVKDNDGVSDLNSWCSGGLVAL